MSRLEYDPTLLKEFAKIACIDEIESIYFLCLRTLT